MAVTLWQCPDCGETMLARDQWGHGVYAGVCCGSGLPLTYEHTIDGPSLLCAVCDCRGYPTKETP